MTSEQLTQSLADLAAQVQKIATESTATLAKVTELETALANADNIPQNVQDAFTALKNQVQVVDDLVPDIQIDQVDQSEVPATPPAGE